MKSDKTLERPTIIFAWIWDLWNLTLFCICVLFFGVQATISEKLSHRCPYCEAVFATKVRLQKHKLWNHPERVTTETKPGVTLDTKSDPKSEPKQQKSPVKGNAKKRCESSVSFSWPSCHLMNFWSGFELSLVTHNKKRFRTWLVFHTAIIRFQLKSSCVTIAPVLWGLTLIACVPCAPSQAHGEQPSITRIFQGEEDPGGVSALTEWGVRPPKAGQETAAGHVCRRWGQWERGGQFTPTLSRGGPWENEAQ